MSFRRSTLAPYQPLPSTQEEDLGNEEPWHEDPEIIPTNHSPDLVDAPIWRIQFVLGCCLLLPWNVMITATPYFLSRLSGSAYRQTFNSYLSVTFLASNFIFLAHATATSKQCVPSRQTPRTIVCLAFLTLLLTLSTFFRVTPGLFFTFVILNGIAQAAFGSYLTTSVVAVSSLLGPTALQAMMSGQAAVAVAVSSVQVASSAIFLSRATPESLAANTVTGSAEEQAAFVFFALSTGFLVLGAFSNQWLVSMPVYNVTVAPLEGKHVTQTGGDREEGRLQNSFTDATAQILHVLRVNIVYEISVAYVFMITISVYPSLTALIEPVNPTFHPLLFSATHFLIFNFGDWFGRYILAYPKLLIWSANRLAILSFGRTLFVPLFLACNIQRSSAPSIPSSVLINSDLLFFFILFLFGMSNGYVSTLILMSAPSLDHNPRLKDRKEDVDIAATVANFCLVGGLVLGSVSSFAVRALVCACNPFIE